MTKIESGIPRRDFLRLIGVAGLGFSLSIEKCLTGAVRADPFYKAKEGIVAGLDIGTSKVCLVVGQRQSDRTIKILGGWNVPSRGVFAGEVVDIEATRRCLLDALAYAEVKSDVLIRSVYLGIANPNITSLNYRSSVMIPKSQEGVQERDVEKARANAHEAGIPPQNAIIHLLPQRYYVGGQKAAIDPVGMKGTKLEADFHIVHGDPMRTRNPIRCVKEMPLEIENIIFNPLATAQAVLTQSEKNLGALVIDIGGGTADYIVYVDGAVTQSGVLGVGGDKSTRDLLAGAEHGERNRGTRDGMRKTFGSIKDRLEATGARFALLQAGVQLTGGGSMLRGIGELVQEIFGLPAHLASIEGIAGPPSILENRQYSCAIGLLKYGEGRLTI